MKKFLKILSAAVAPAIMLGMLALPAAADSALTMLNDCSDPSQFSGQPGLIFGASADSPDGKAVEIEYEYPMTFNLKSNVPEDQRAADAEKQYFCFWIKTPYSECDSGIFFGLKEGNTDDGNLDMIWNGNDGGYKGNIIAVDKNGTKSYIKAGRLLVLKPGFEGYIAIPIKTALARHPGWGNSGNQIFEYDKIDEIQIWFDGSHAAYDEKYAFDNFMLAADENAFVNMVTATGITVKDAAASTPSASSQAPAQSEETPTSEPDVSSEASSDSADTSSASSTVSNTTANDTQPSSSGSSGNVIAFIIVGVVVLLAAAAILIFIYKPKFIFKNKSENPDVTENTDK